MSAPQKSLNCLWYVGLMQANRDFFFGFVPNKKFRNGTLVLLGKCLNWFW
jgi:hypothetical protein